uniref:Uncharacterized protein n=1 Tax=Arundo donax TaxID=35708 RepID=A0A0A9B6T0_ARUDO
MLLRIDNAGCYSFKLSNDSKKRNTGTFDTLEKNESFID